MRSQKFVVTFLIDGARRYLTATGDTTRVADARQYTERRANDVAWQFREDNYGIVESVDVMAVPVAPKRNSRRSPPLAQPSLFDARRSPVPLTADDRLMLFLLFDDGRSSVIDRNRVMEVDAGPLRRAIEAGYVVDGRNQYILTPAGADIVAREGARLIAQSRREEAEMGAAMRREGARDSAREYAPRPAPAAPRSAPSPRAAAGAPTDLNLWVLSELFGGAASVPNRTQATSIPHLRRCLKAGLITATKERLTLTPVGVAALERFRASQPGAPKLNPRSNHDATRRRKRKVR